MRNKVTGNDDSIPHGMVVWSIDVGTRPVVKDFIEQVGLGDRRVLATDEWLRVKGCSPTYCYSEAATRLYGTTQKGAHVDGCERWA